MHKQLRLTTLLVALALPVAALAHGPNAVHLKGFVKSVGEQSLVVTGTDKKEVTVKATADTSVQRGDRAATLAEIEAGERIVVHAKKTKSGEVVAVLLKLAARAKPEPAPAPSKGMQDAGADHSHHDH